jgi:sugar phosphate isomerase/epimerase
VHLKDRNKMGSHPPGEGDVNFSIILQTLFELDYKNIYTLQTCRRISGNEIETAISDIKYFNKIKMKNEKLF